MLTKPTKYKIEETNLANFGTELEKNVKKAAAQTEPAWKAAGQAEGLMIWRIEKFKVVAWPKDEYGNFFSGDSYIVLWTYKKTPEALALSYNVHFWLGSETTQDEAGTAAYKTVELDDMLNGVPVQYRECEGHESPTFKSYFKLLKVMAGGVATGFRHVEAKNYKNRLLQVKGWGDNIVIREVPCAADSLNAGDVFILDAGLNIFVLNGAQSNATERLRADQACSALCAERASKPTVKNITQNDNDSDEFWTALGGRGEVKPAVEGGEDKEVKADKILWRLTDRMGTHGSQKEIPESDRKPYPPFAFTVPDADASKDADVVKSAFSFFGVKDAVLINVLGQRTLEQRLQIAQIYKTKTKQDLSDRFGSRLHGNFCRTLQALLMEPREIDAVALYNALNGPVFTNNVDLIDILCNRTNAQLAKIMEIYQAKYNKSLKETVLKDTWFDLRKFFSIILECKREESQGDEARAAEDAKRLFDAGEARLGTDEDAFIDILARRSFQHLNLVAKAYSAISNQTLTKVIKSEFSGSLRDALYATVKLVTVPRTYFAHRLFQCMNGFGTDDRTLLRMIVMHREADLYDIIQEFERAFRHTTFAEMLSNDTSGSYRSLLFTLCGLPRTGSDGGVEAEMRARKEVKVEMQEVARGKISRGMLDPADIFLVDVGFEIFVWVGRCASKLERAQALQHAQTYLIVNKRPFHTPICRVFDGAENSWFRQAFDSDK